MLVRERQPCEEGTPLHGDGRLRAKLKLPFELTGAQKRSIAEIEPGDKVYAYDLESLEPVKRRVTAVRESGVQAVYGIETKNHRKVTRSARASRRARTGAPCDAGDAGDEDPDERRPAHPPAPSP